MELLPIKSTKQPLTDLKNMNKEKCLEMGKNAESMFVELCRQHNIQCFSSSKEEDMYEHIDFFISYNKSPKLSVEVKSAKKLSRHDDEVDFNLIYVEFKNVRGNPGWLYGKADYIAFQQKNCFLLVKRKKLIDIAETRVTMNFTSKPTLYKSYRRKDRPNEHVGLIHINDILSDDHISLKFLGDSK